MLIEPIDETTASPLPRRLDPTTGVFAWGRSRLSSLKLGLAWLEFLFVFAALPAIAIAADAISAIPIVFMIMVSCAVVALSMTRSFHWRDLTPVDPLSEWRLVAKLSLSFAALAAAVTLLFFPDRFFVAEIGVLPMLVAFPVLTAFPLELVYRALLMRRYGHLFKTEWAALLVGAAANALAYYVICHTFGGALFGAFVGVAVGWFYLRTGQFALGVLLHWIAALCVWVIGPGLTFL